MVSNSEAGGSLTPPVSFRGICSRSMDALSGAHVKGTPPIDENGKISSGDV